ncbi:hypothetical protein Syun_022210 [Stephania yunnanensis]|uniref:PB1 domain-containing protein n=1 Tax=Stephania yunnanensis TaxID=152371 RepID=A0AAP0II30_9MAGN
MLCCLGKSSATKSDQLQLLCNYYAPQNSSKSSTSICHRVVEVDRRWSASKLLRHLAATLFGDHDHDHQSFTLKYQLKVSGVKSLVSVDTDEDLRLMIQAHDRLIIDFSNNKVDHCYLLVFVAPKNGSVPDFFAGCDVKKDEKKEERKKVDLSYKQQLRLTCRYGGSFYYYPCRNLHSYVGGENRVVVMDRPPSLLSLSRHLEHVLLEGSGSGSGSESWVLKYESPREGLDCLLSLRTDEDLKNMMEVYDGVSFSIRVYLFKRVESSVDDEVPVKQYESSTRIEVVEDHKYCKLHDEMQFSRNNFVNRQMEETTIEIDHATGLPLKRYY